MESIETGPKTSHTDADNRHYVLLDVLLLLFWFLLTGTLFSIFSLKDISILSVLAGVISTSAVTLIVHKFVIRGNAKNKSTLSEYLMSLGHLIVLMLDVVLQLIIANAIILYQSLSMNIEPRIVEVKVNLVSDAEVTLISSLITLIPGTLVIDVEKRDGWYYLYVHYSYMKAEDLEENMDNTINRWDRLIRGVFR